MTTTEAIRRRQRETNVLLVITLLAIAGLFLYQFVVINPQNADTQDQLKANQLALHENLVHSCEVAGDPQRLTLIGLLRDQIQQSQAANLQQFFPSVPPDQLRHLIRQANEQRRLRIQQLQDVPSCRQRFK